MWYDVNTNEDVIKIYLLILGAVFKKRLLIVNIKWQYLYFLEHYRASRKYISQNLAGVR